MAWRPSIIERLASTGRHSRDQHYGLLVEACDGNGSMRYQGFSSTASDAVLRLLTDANARSAESGQDGPLKGRS